MRNYEERALGTGTPLAASFLISVGGPRGTLGDRLTTISSAEERGHPCHCPRCCSFSPRGSLVSLAGFDLGMGLIGPHRECPKAMPPNCAETDKTHRQSQLEKSQKASGSVEFGLLTGS